MRTAGSVPVALAKPLAIAIAVSHDEHSGISGISSGRLPTCKFLPNRRPFRPRRAKHPVDAVTVENVDANRSTIHMPFLCPVLIAKVKRGMHVELRP